LTPTHEHEKNTKASMSKNNPKEDFSKSVKLLFPTPVFDHQFKDTDELNRDLKKLLLMMEKAQPEKRTGGFQKSNVGGWRSDEHLLTKQDTCIQKLTSLISEAVGVITMRSPFPQEVVKTGKCNMVGWANINRNDSFNYPHIHGGYHWAAVYYVATGNPDKEHVFNGSLQLFDPRSNAPATPVPGYDFGKLISIQPVAGKLILFPAWFSHMVMPFHGSDARISIAININMVG